MPGNFIVVDDDRINNMICRKVIEQVFPQADVQIFTDPHQALHYIQTTFTHTNAADAVLFLDINMPTLTGWEFLDAFQNLQAGVKEHFTIYMLSSSIDPNDKEHAATYDTVTGYLEKPLTRDKVESLFDEG